MLPPLQQVHHLQLSLQLFFSSLPPQDLLCDFQEYWTWNYSCSPRKGLQYCNFNKSYWETDISYPWEALFEWKRLLTPIFHTENSSCQWMPCIFAEQLYPSQCQYCKPSQILAPPPLIVCVLYIFQLAKQMSKRWIVFSRRFIFFTFSYLCRVTRIMFSFTYSFKYFPDLFDRVCKLINGNRFRVITVKYSKCPLDLFMKGFSIT